jgi:hypothetical protein
MTLEELEKEVTRLEDIHEIENLQKIYGYYFDNRQMKEIVDLFSENTESVEIESHGVYLGKKGIRTMYWQHAGDSGKPKPKDVAGHRTVITQLDGVITFSTDGQTAKGRWQTWLAETFPFAGVMGQYWLHGYYENEYIKENGQWLFKKLFWNPTFYTRFETGWLVQPLVGLLPMPNPDRPPTAFHPYPSGYHFPYSFPHPITGEIDNSTYEVKNPMRL